MFPKINSIFKKKEIAQINTLKIPFNSSILIDAKLNINQLETDKNENIIINSLQDKLVDIIGAHFASIK